MIHFNGCRFQCVCIKVSSSVLRVVEQGNCQQVLIVNLEQELSTSCVSLCTHLFVVMKAGYYINV